MMTACTPFGWQQNSVEEQTHARAQQDLMAISAKADGLKEELARTSQLLIDGALDRYHGTPVDTVSSEPASLFAA